MGSMFRDNLMSDHVAIAKKNLKFAKTQIFIAKSIFIYVSRLLQVYKICYYGKNYCLLRLMF